MCGLNVDLQDVKAALHLQTNFLLSPILRLAGTKASCNRSKEDYATMALCTRIEGAGYGTVLAGTQMLTKISLLLFKTNVEIVLHDCNTDLIAIRPHQMLSIFSGILYSLWSAELPVLESYFLLIVTVLESSTTRVGNMKFNSATRSMTMTKQRDAASAQYNCPQTRAEVAA